MLAVGIGVAVVDAAVDENQFQTVAYVEMQASAKQSRKYSVQGMRPKVVMGQQRFVEIWVDGAVISFVGCFGGFVVPSFLRFEGHREILAQVSQ